MTEDGGRQTGGSRRLTRGASLLAAVAGLALGAWGALGIANAATGDNLNQFDADAAPCSVGTGIAFDGTQLYLSCWSNNILERVSPTDGSSNGTITVTGMEGIQAMAFDGSRNGIWACGNGQVFLIDLGDNTAESKFASEGCTDGLAYDNSDDSIWASADVASSIQHFSTDGTKLGSFPLSGLIGSCGNSGIAVGGEDLYLANNGCSQIYQCDKSLTACSLLSEFPRRIEDLECDNVTFAPKAAIWSQDAYDRTLNAWEIPSGTCFFGGGGEGVPPAGEPTATTTACIPPLIGLKCGPGGSNGGGGSSRTATAVPPTQAPVTPVSTVAGATAVAPTSVATRVSQPLGVVRAPDTGYGWPAPDEEEKETSMALLIAALVGGVVLAGGGALNLRRNSKR